MMPPPSPPQGKKIRLNTVIITKIKVQSISVVTLTNIASNKLRGDKIKLGALYVCDYAHYEILETIFSREELHDNELFLEGEVESSDY